MIDNTSRPGNSYESAPERGKVLERPAEPLQQQQQMQSLGNQAEGVACPNCGAMNDPGGSVLRVVRNSTADGVVPQLRRGDGARCRFL